MLNIAGSRDRVVRTACAVTGLVLALAASSGCSGDPYHMMPESCSTEADRIDELTYLIFWVTTVTFVGVEAALVWFLWAYRRKASPKAKHTHGNHTVEMIWTVAPAAILVFLAVYQMGLWGEMKSSLAPADKKGRRVQLQILARQFEWHFRYPGRDAKFGTDDDMRTEGYFVVPAGAIVEAEQRALDVIHSFYLPNMRTKQDVVPGLHTKLWFQPTKLSSERRPIEVEKGKPPVRLDYWDVVCAELCGNQHTSMAARMYVVTDAEYETFLGGGKLTKLMAVRDGVTPADATRELQLQPWDRTATRGGDAYWVQWHAQDVQVVTKRPAEQRNPFVGKKRADDEEEDE